MKQDLLDMLMSLISDYIQEDEGIDLLPETFDFPEDARDFKTEQIEYAYDLFDEITERSLKHINSRLNFESLRVFDPCEQDKIGVHGCNLLLALERRGILSNELRESILDNVMSINVDYVTESEFKWIILMVLYHHSEKTSILAWANDLDISSREKLH